MADLIPYIMGVITGTAIVTFLALYPFYLERHKPERYTGIWKKMGEMNGNPKRAMCYPIGWVVGNLILLAFIV
ncbi:MAG: hypothetical protein QMC78_01790 [Methanocellales archaeon]|nr:hypothetical protein [Methanocellales archaeon]